MSGARVATAPRPARRGGWLDLVLVLCVVFAAWTRTPVGGIAAHTANWAFGWQLDEPALTSYFRIERSWERLAGHLEGTHPLPAPLPTTTDGFPEPYRTAAMIVLEEEAVLTELDALYDGDPAVTLERWAIGDEAREQAIAKARRTGRANPESYTTYRTWLPEQVVKRADQSVDGVLAVALLLDVQWPVAGEHRVSSGYGMRVHPITGIRTLHNGVDLAVPIGTPITAPQDGSIDAQGEDDRSGRWLSIDHGHGVRTVYCHLEERLAAKGSTVGQGEVVAYSGNTGRSTGPHLHFIVKVNGKSVDPMPLHREGTAVAAAPAEP